MRKKKSLEMAHLQLWKLVGEYVLISKKKLLFQDPSMQQIPSPARVSDIYKYSWFRDCIIHKPHLQTMHKNGL